MHKNKRVEKIETCIELNKNILRLIVQVIRKQVQELLYPVLSQAYVYYDMWVLLNYQIIQGSLQRAHIRQGHLTTWQVVH